MNQLVRYSMESFNVSQYLFVPSLRGPVKQLGLRRSLVHHEVQFLRDASVFCVDSLHCNISLPAAGSQERHGGSHALKLVGSEWISAQNKIQLTLFGVSLTKTVKNSPL